jgi:hypothetical protein
MRKGGYDGSVREANRRKILLLLVLIATVAGCCRAEPRWCAVTGIGENQNLIYPPIARAAHVNGVVLERVIYLPDGQVKEFEYIHGPRLLSAGLEQQIKSWSIKTDQRGEEECEALVVAEFQIDEVSGQSVAKPIDITVPGILKLGANTTPICLCDPGAEIDYGSIFQRLGRKIVRIFHRIH